MERQIKDAEDLLDRTPDPNAHAELDSRIKGGKANLVRLPRWTSACAVAKPPSILSCKQRRQSLMNSPLDALMSELKGP